MKKANISWITPNLATGGDLSPHEDEAEDQIRQIIEEGITSIVDLRIEDSDEWVWEAAGVPYASIGTMDEVGHTVPFEVFDEVVRLGRMESGAGRKILVHCHMGINRGPSAAFAILLDRGHPPVEAYKMILKARPIVGMVYANDALDAHIARMGIASVKARVLRRQVKDFELNYWTEERAAKVTHTIRAHSEMQMDARQRMAEKLNRIRR